MVEPMTLPRVVPPVAPGHRVQRAKASEDRSRGFAFARHLRRERGDRDDPENEGDETPGREDGTDTGAAEVGPVADEGRTDESAGGETQQTKTIDIRV